MTLVIYSKKVGFTMTQFTIFHNVKTYERIELKVKKGQKDYIQKAAASVGKSVNRFILDLVAKETGNDEI